MMHLSPTIKLFSALPTLCLTTILLFDCSVATAQTTPPSLMFNFPSGFTGAGNSIQTIGMAVFNGSALALTTGTAVHQTGCAWYKTPQNIQTFTTDFSFQLPPNGVVPSIQGITFTVQNSNNNTNPGQYGTNECGDSNLAGYDAYIPIGQVGIGNSVAVKFDLNSYGNYSYPSGGKPNSTGLYINGGPSSSLIPANDLNPYGINLYSGHVMSAHLVYDGNLLTMVLKDTTTNAQARYSWPVNIPAITGGNTAYVGITAGEVEANTIQNVLSWDYYTGYNTRLATPTFNVAPGSYASAQNVTINGPSGAAIYYTTNGLQPTSSSLKYSGPISVNATEIIQAVAIQSGYTDSFVAAANYEIATPGTPLINFPNGFSGASNLIIPIGYAQFNGSSIQLTDNVNTSEVAAAWYAVPVNVSSFTTSFQFQNTNAQANGFTFAIQNQPAASSTNTSGKVVNWVSGGPTAFAGSQTGLGYSSPAGSVGQVAGLLSSLAVSFDNTNNTGLYLNGALPSGAGTSISGVNINSGHPINVTLTYNGTTLAMTINDSVTNGTFSHSWAVNIPSIVGGNSAYIGFTASTEDGQGQNLFLKSWTYSPSSLQAVAVPSAPTNLRVQ